MADQRRIAEVFAYVEYSNAERQVAELFAYVEYSNAERLVSELLAYAEYRYLGPGELGPKSQMMG